MFFLAFLPSFILYNNVIVRTWLVQKNRQSEDGAICLKVSGQAFRLICFFHYSANMLGQFQ